MKKNVFTLAVGTLIFLIFNQAFAQTDTTKRTQLYTVSGIGYGFTSGKLNKILKPQYSSNLGVELWFKNSGFFLSAVTDVLSYGYYQDYTEKPQDPYLIKNGSSTFYMLNITPGYRKKFKNVSLYGFIGPGVGLLNLPNASINNTSQIATVVNNYSWIASAKAGLGLDYSLGGFVLFLQGGYIHNFSKVQNREVNIFPVFIGAKSNITGVLTFLGGK